MKKFKRFLFLTLIVGIGAGLAWLSIADIPAPTKRIEVVKTYQDLAGEDKVDAEAKLESHLN